MITPSDSPSSPEGYASVPPSGQGPAPYDIQAPAENLDAIGAAAVAATRPRQAATEQLLSSAQGYGDFNITAGFSGEPGESWPNNPDPGGNMATPDQGMGDYAGTD